MTKENQSEVTMKPPPEKEKWADKFAAPEDLAVKNGREANAGESEAPSNFWQRIAPTSKKGRVVFAAGTAQVVSVTIAAIAGYFFKNHKPKMVETLEGKLAEAFTDHHKSIKGFLQSKSWKGFYDTVEYKQMKRYSKANDYPAKHRMQAVKLVEIGVMGAVNVLSSICSRNYLDEKLDIGLGSGKVLKTQMLDTAVGVGMMVVIPSVFPKTSRTMREGISDGLQNTLPPKTEENKDKRKKFAKSAAFSVVNLGIPDLFGFVVGLGATLRELDAKDKADKAEKELKAAKGMGI